MYCELSPVNGRALFFLILLQSLFLDTHYLSLYSHVSRAPADWLQTRVSERRKWCPCCWTMRSPRCFSSQLLISRYVHTLPHVNRCRHDDDTNALIESQLNYVGLSNDVQRVPKLPLTLYVFAQLLIFFQSIKHLILSWNMSI